MAREVITYVISPIHAMTSLCAVWTRHPREEVSVTVVVHWPGAGDDVLFELTEIVAEMQRWTNCVRRVVAITQAQLTESLALGGAARLGDAVRAFTGTGNVDEIYYPHDVTGQMYQALATAYPRARRICFGDGLGMVFERDIHLGYLREIVGPRSRLRTAGSDLAYRIKRRVVRSLGLRSVELDDFAPHEAALVLPIDQSGRFLQRVPLRVCPRALVIDTLEHCATSCALLQQYVGELLNRYRGRRIFLLLTENGAEGGFIDFDREVDMYCSVIEQTCPPESLLLLKSHPAESLPRNERIRARLESRVEVVELDRRFRRYPIELWSELLRRATVICMSSPVLSLKYLYDVDVVQPMDDAFIERWYPHWTWPSYKNAVALYMEPLAKLPKWGGSGILWAGQPPDSGLKE